MAHTFRGRRLKWWIRILISTVVYVTLLNLFSMATGADNAILVLGSLAGFASAFTQDML